MIDSHCHLDHEPLINNLNDVLERSKKVGIDKLLTISTNINSYKNILNLINQDPMIYGSNIVGATYSSSICFKVLTTPKEYA